MQSLWRKPERRNQRVKGKHRRNVYVRPKRPRKVTINNEISFEGKSNTYEVCAVAKLMSDAIENFLPILENKGEDIVAKFANIVMDPLLKWAENHK